MLLKANNLRCCLRRSCPRAAEDAREREKQLLVIRREIGTCREREKERERECKTESKNIQLHIRRESLKSHSGRVFSQHRAAPSIPSTTNTSMVWAIGDLHAQTSGQWSLMQIGAAHSCLTLVTDPFQFWLSFLDSTRSIALIRPEGLLGKSSNNLALAC